MSYHVPTTIIFLHNHNLLTKKTTRKKRMKKLYWCKKKKKKESTYGSRVWPYEQKLIIEMCKGGEYIEVLL